MAQATEQRIFNFSAGPATLPLSSLEEAQRHLLAYPGMGASIMEISHRSKAFEAVLQQAKANVKSLLKLPEGYHVLFLQGGASLQFSMLAMNFLRGKDKSADYILTGSWGSKAIKEAKKEGSVQTAWTGKAENFVRVPRPSELKLDPNAAYVHFTSNETIEGVEFFDEPPAGDVPLICDASSNFLSRPIPADRYAMIYAGAQKNLGPAGVTLVILRNNMLARVPENLPSMLDYRLAVENDSLYNTPCCFGIYMVMLVTKWLVEEIGGLEKMADINRRKAQLLYDAIDASGGFYRGHAQADCRSWMNVTWRLPNEALEGDFVKQAKERGLDGLKGHRSVGGIRASIYNAMPTQGVERLCEFMAEFKKKNA